MAIKKTIRVFACEKCGQNYTSEHTANICCKQYYCEVCGSETEKYHLKCPSCHEKDVYEKAKKMTIEEYEKLYPDNMIFHNDKYFSDVEELLESYSGNDSELPEYCYGTTLLTMKFDPDNSLIQAEEDADCEDFVFPKEAYKELREFAEEWNKKYERDYFFYDSEIIILIPEDVRNEHKND